MLQRSEPIPTIIRETGAKSEKRRGPREEARAPPPKRPLNAPSKSSLASRGMRRLRRVAGRSRDNKGSDEPAHPCRPRKRAARMRSPVRRGSGCRFAAANASSRLVHQLPHVADARIKAGEDSLPNQEMADVELGDLRNGGDGDGVV